MRGRASWARRFLIGMIASQIAIAPLGSTVAAADQLHRIELAGDIAEFALPLSVSGLALAFQDYEGLGQLGLTFGTTMALVWALKLAINAERPNGGPYSLPSGHTASVFSAASFGQRRYGPAVGVPYYLAAAYTGWSRVYTDNHFARDVAVGAGLAIASSFIFVRRIEGRTTLLPWGGRGQYGLRISRDF